MLFTFITMLYFGSLGLGCDQKLNEQVARFMEVSNVMDDMEMVTITL